MRGRLGSPENWDGMLKKFGIVLGSLGTDLRTLLVHMCCLCVKLWFRCCETGNDHGFRFHKVEPMLSERAAHGQPTSQFGTVKNSPDVLVRPKNVHVKLLEVNGLNRVENNMLMHGIKCVSMMFELYKI